MRRPSTLLQNPTLFRALKLYAAIFLGLLLLPFYVFTFIWVSVSFFLILPILCVFVLACFLCKILFPSLIAGLGMVLHNIYARFLHGSRPSVNGSILDQKVEDRMEEQVTQRLDFSEIPSLFDSEEEEEADAGRQGLWLNEDSRQNGVQKSVKREKIPFHETLSFWKEKEKGQL